MREVKPGSVKMWLLLEKKKKEANDAFKVYDKLIKSLPKGVHKFKGCPDIEIIEYKSSVLDTERILNLDPTLQVLRKNVKKRKVKHA